MDEGAPDPNLSSQVGLLNEVGATARPGMLNSAALASIIASAMDAIITIDADQRIVLFNSAAEKMFRISFEEALGQPIDRFLPARYRDAHRAHVPKFGATHVTKSGRWARSARSTACAPPAKSSRSKPPSRT
jgi:PAS domain-containing protein